MKHVKQDHYECSLAVCSMISGAEYSEVQKYAWNKYPMRTGKGYRPEHVTDIFREFGLPYIDSWRMEAAPTLNLHKLKLPGTGHILYKINTMVFWHHIAYSNGAIFDAQEHGEMPLEIYARDKASTHGEAITKCKVVVTQIAPVQKKFHFLLDKDQPNRVD